MARHRRFDADGDGRGLPDAFGLQQLLPDDGAGARLDLYGARRLLILAAGHGALGALLFALFDSFQLRLQTVLNGVVPYQLFLMIPYGLSIAALVVMSRRARVPQALDATLPAR